MIVVVADDLTGAAEIAGLGLNYGFNVEMVSSVTPSSADMLIIATNTRSMNRQEAYDGSIRLAKELKNLNFDWLYKKTDSVLRGHVLVELIAFLENDIKDCCLLVPANPKLNRKIREGIYYINNKPLTETDFVNDPGYMIKSADVMELLGRAEGISTHYLKPNKDVRFSGVCLGEANTAKHLTYWARQVTERVLPAGAAEFFEAIIQSKKIRRVRSASKFKSRANAKVLIVCGSAFKTDRAAIEAAREHGARVCEMPDDVFYHNETHETAMKRWRGQIISQFENTNCVIVEINKPVVSRDGIGGYLSNAMAKTVTGVLDNVDIGELYIEGGDTARAVLKEAGFGKFQPFEEVAHGTIRMHAAGNPDICITLKVGSYKWPDGIWKFTHTNSALH